MSSVRFRSGAAAMVTLPERRSRSAHDTVLRGLGSAIVSGELPVGAMLPSKDELSRQFGVSHTSLREALQTLSAKGLIAAKTKIGTWVQDESHWNMFDADILAWRLAKGADHGFVANLFEIRQAFEPAAAAIAALRRSDSHVAELRRHLEAMGEASSDKQGFTDADVAFHLCVLDASANPFMRSIGALIATALAASFALSAPTDNAERATTAYRQHAAIVDAIEAQCPQAAADAMLQAIRQGWTIYSGLADRPLANLSVRSVRE
ncbi:transcriptional regulator, GntR family [Rhizobiales bacterium GAS113]|nr:transcriptional regulator, GntR family [Rhizobiales bacterium GAS113]SEE25901.1 transcriptional regulator, GntR family [Rhizobiales bacterium GAS188]